jgi:hypothetical protein
MTKEPKALRTDCMRRCAAIESAAIRVTPLRAMLAIGLPLDRVVLEGMLFQICRQVLEHEEVQFSEVPVEHDTMPVHGVGERTPGLMLSLGITRTEVLGREAEEKEKTKKK